MRRYTPRHPRCSEGAARSNLGIVAKSRGFPREIEGDLTFRQSYSLLAGISVHKPTEHPPRLITGVIGTKKDLYCLSQTVFAGSDHTGRTTPLAHHLVFNIQEMAKAKASPAAILSACSQVFKEQWNQPPAWIDPPRTLPQLTPPEQQGEFPGKHWSQVVDCASLDAILAAVSDGLLAFPRTQRRLIFCIPVVAGRFVAQFVADILTLVPADVQLQVNCVSHVVDSSDCPQEAAIVFTYPDTPFLAQHIGRTDSRAPLLFDLTIQNVASKTPLGKYGTAIAGILRSDSQKDQLAFARDINGLIEAGPQDPNYFPSVSRLFQHLRHVKSGEELPALGTEAGRIAQSSTLAMEEVSRWSAQMVQSRLCRFSEPQRWVALAAVAWNKQWPSLAQNTALRLIHDNARIALPAFLNGVAPGSGAYRSCRVFLAKLLASDNSLVEESLTRLVATPTKEAVNQAILLINSLPSQKSGRELVWAAQSLDAPREIHAPLVTCILERLFSATDTPTPDWLDALLSKVNGANRGSVMFLRQIYIPLLRHLLSRTPLEEDVWRNFAARWIEIMLQEKSFDEIRWLVSTFRDRIKSEVQDEWRERARSQGKIDVLDDLLQGLGLLRQQYEPPARTERLSLEELTLMPTKCSGTTRRNVRKPFSVPLSPALLALSTAAMCSLPEVVRLCNPKLPDIDGFIHADVALWIAISAGALWAITEVVLQSIRGSSLLLPRLKFARWLIIAALSLALGVLTFRVGDIVCHWHWIRV